jgi:hypothetical protein
LEVATGGAVNYSECAARKISNGSPEHEHGFDLDSAAIGFASRDRAIV